jgi:hypothetical protein
MPQSPSLIITPRHDPLHQTFQLWRSVKASIHPIWKLGDEGEKHSRGGWFRGLFPRRPQEVGDDRYSKMRVIGQGFSKGFYLQGRRGRYKLLDICWRSGVGEWQKALASSPTSSPCSVPMYNAEIKIRRLAFRISDYDE